MTLRQFLVILEYFYTKKEATMSIPLIRRNGSFFESLPRNPSSQGLQNEQSNSVELIQKELEIDITQESLEDLLNLPLIQNSMYFDQISVYDSTTQKRKILKKRGYDLDKPDIILINEFKPLANNIEQTAQTISQNNINIEFDNLNLNFNNIIKLFEMHRLSNEIMINSMQNMLNGYSTYSKEENYDLYEYFKFFLKSTENVNTILESQNNVFNINTAAEKLIEIATLSDVPIASSTLNNSQNQSSQSARTDAIAPIITENMRAGNQSQLLTQRSNQSNQRLGDLIRADREGLTLSRNRRGS